LKIATWNVNSLKVRLPHLLDWLSTHAPDVVCLQELKCEDKALPLPELEAAGYQVAAYGQKTYNGVAILSRAPMTEIVRGIAGFDDEQRRVIAATVDGLRIVCGYFPNGQALGSEKFAYKLRWLEALTAWLRAELLSHPAMVLAGDFNIAPEDRDAHVEWREPIHVTPPEREAFQALVALGFVDAYRCFEQAEKSFSWWDYRMMAFRRNFGLRIDHLLVTPAVQARLLGCWIDRAPRKLDKPSDHAPVTIELRR
jgi:exodeoxyribonuclease-3